MSGSIVTTTTPATTYDLVDLDDVKEELEITGSDDDSALQRWITGTSLRFANACGRKFARETLTEVFRSVWCVEFLSLRRRPIVSITSVTVDGSTLSVGDYETDLESGRVYRLSSDSRLRWSASKITVVNVAGFSSVPQDVSEAIITIIRHKAQTAGRDPTTKSFAIDGVGREDYWVPLQEGRIDSLPLDLQPVADTIAYYRQPVIA